MTPKTNRATRAIQQQSATTLQQAYEHNKSTSAARRTRCTATEQRVGLNTWHTHTREKINHRPPIDVSLSPPLFLGTFFLWLLLWPSGCRFLWCDLWLLPWLGVDDPAVAWVLPCTDGPTQWQARAMSGQQRAGIPSSGDVQGRVGCGKEIGITSNMPSPGSGKIVTVRTLWDTPGTAPR